MNDVGAQGNSFINIESEIKSDISAKISPKSFGTQQLSAHPPPPPSAKASV